MKLPQCEYNFPLIRMGEANIRSLLLHRYSLAATVQVRLINPDSSALSKELC